MRTKIRRGLVAATGACAVALCTAAPAAAQSQPYIALGDSAAAGVGATGPSQRYVDLLYTEWQESLDVDALINRAEPGASISSVRNGGQLTQALADINAASDTRAVTLSIGGTDVLGGNCPGNWNEQGVCPARGSLAAILTDLDAALEADLGDERFVVMLQYNPSVGTDLEESRDEALLGANRSVSCTDFGTNVGLNDLILQEAGKRGIAVANPYPAFKADASLMSPDGINPNDAGHRAIYSAFSAAVVTPCVESADTDAPETTITKEPKNRSTKTKVKFKFVSDEPGSTFECRIDKKPFKPCTSPKKLKVKPGKHRFQVRALDAAGNPDLTADSDRFRVVE